MVMIKYLQSQQKKMIFLNLLLAIVILSQGIISVDVKKLYYEKDLSEYCKRRVMPSIFLGSQVVEASAFILHFTKLTLPYSCFISIRSESGNNLIMALTLPNEGLEMSCSANRPQLLVYEIGETFGGYWGMLPESVVKPRPPQKAKYYTLKTTQATTTATEPSTEEYTEPTTQKTTRDQAEDTQGYIRVEVPLVDVSGHLVPGSEQPTTPFDIAEAFDYQYDVTPIPGVKYDTSIMPLVQLSVRKQTDSGRRDGQEPRYELDVIEEFTPDPRLTLPHLTPNKHRVTENRHMSFGKKRVTKNKRRKNFGMTTTKNSKYTKYVFPTTTPTTTMKTNKLTRNSWEIIDKLMEKLKRNKDDLQDRIDIQQHKGDRKNTLELAENISNMKHNYSIYLQPNLSVYNASESEISSPPTTKKISSLFTTSTTHSSKKLPLKHSEIKSMTAHEKITASSQITSQFSKTFSIENFSHKTNAIGMESHNNVNISQTELSEFNVIGLPNTISSVSLLDHESWESILQVAPSMAVLLNQTVSHNVNSDRSSLNETHRKKLLARKKRSIQAIEIENGRPHTIATQTYTSTTTKRPFNLADMQEFARMVELKDDEVHGRVALRYLRQYVGPTIYNICGNPQLPNRHVFLFNSSRIVLSLQNFSLSSISVILTGARTLLSSEMMCPSSQLECQVSGARVCVDSLAACDGVPNCGSYDIYDEDRLMCGVALGLRRYVYLAAFTFLALLLTLCYAAHYWLRRCVPHVAEAFFVYTNGIENILYMDSIMRPPGDMEDGSKFFYAGGMLSSQSEELMKEPKKILRSSHFYIQFFRKIFYCFRKKKAEDDLDDEHVLSLENKKTFSFTQIELSNISHTFRSTVDTSVQTGESLEMAIIHKQCEHKVMNMNTASNQAYEQYSDSRKPPIMINDSIITLDEPLAEDELSLMRFFRDSRSDSNDSINTGGKGKMDFSTGAAQGGEIEISSIIYDGLSTRPGPSGVKVKAKAQSKVGQSRKRLRFNEITTTIPTLSDNEEDEVEFSRQRKQARSSIQNRSWRAQHLSTIKEDDEPVGKHRHFWESKGKKSSKKAKASLREFS